MLVQFAVYSLIIAFVGIAVLGHMLVLQALLFDRFKTTGATRRLQGPAPTNLVRS